MILGLIALAIAAVAAFAAVVKFSVDLRLGSASENAQETDASLPSPARFPASDYHQSRFPRLTGRPLIGVNYTHYDFPTCSFRGGTGILRSYSQPGVAQRVHAQLFQMRKAGLATIRTIIWHMSDATGQYWGPVSSAGGRLHEPYRTNLIRFATEIRKFGFKRLTIVFAPKGPNDPLAPTYEPAKLRENWRFIRTVRFLVKRYGPAKTRVDLVSEGAPSRAPTHWSPVPGQTRRYLRAIYRRYVKRYGNRDVTISTIAWDMKARLQTLVHTLKSTGKPLPRWYDVRVGYDSSRALYVLRYADTVLNRNRQSQPLVLGEVPYDNRRTAKAIGTFLEKSSRRIQEVSPWPLRTSNRCNVPPPYKPGAYGELRGR